MAYLKGGTYVDGDLYIDGTIKVKNIDIIGGNSTVILNDGSASVRKDSLLKFATSETDVRAGAVEFSSVYVKEEITQTGRKNLVLTFGNPGADQDSWTGGTGEQVEEVHFGHPVKYTSIIDNTLYLNKSTRTWSYTQA